MQLAYTALFLALSVNFGECRNNVCKRIADYKRLFTSRNCYYNPDVGATGPELITRYGYPFEVYKLTSPDGYILGLFRIPNNSTDKKAPLLLHHGLTGDSRHFLLNGNNSIAFFMHRTGYDVWLVNARGGPYSNQHVKYSVGDKEYWDFSFHEMGFYDIPTIVEFIAAKTGQKVHYIGHSMGTTVSFIYASLKPKHAKTHLKNIVALAPIAYLGHIKGLYRIVSQFTDIIKRILLASNFYGATDDSNLTLFRRICIHPAFLYLCYLMTLVASGLSIEEVIPEDIPLFVSAFPLGFSVKTLEHYSQLISAPNRFQFFDYGFKKNLFLYRSPTPPEYPVEQITTPISMFYGPNDFLAVESDVLAFYARLNTRKNISKIRNFAHTDFVGGRHAPEFFLILLRHLT